MMVTLYQKLPYANKSESLATYYLRKFLHLKWLCPVSGKKKKGGEEYQQRPIAEIVWISMTAYRGNFQISRKKPMRQLTKL